MSKTKIQLTATYQKRLGDVEDFIWESSGKNLLAIEAFLTAHDQAISFIKENPETPSFHPETGDRSWPFGNGRYRLFYRFSGKAIVLLDLIDNRMSNLNIYPNNVIPTYDED